MKIKITEIKNILFKPLNKVIKERHKHKIKNKFVNNFDELLREKMSNNDDYKVKFFEEVR